MNHKITSKPKRSPNNLQSHASNQHANCACTCTCKYASRKHKMISLAASSTMFVTRFQHGSTQLPRSEPIELPSRPSQERATSEPSEPKASQKRTGRAANKQHEGSCKLLRLAWTHAWEENTYTMLPPTIQPRIGHTSSTYSLLHQACKRHTSRLQHSANMQVCTYASIKHGQHIHLLWRNDTLTLPLGHYHF